MKIFYAVQATGNGHISRAMEILPYLQQYGNVDIFLSGSNSQLSMDTEIKYRSKGISLFYGSNGSLSYTRIAASLAPCRILQEVRQLPVEKYDLVINDFECITALACAHKKIRSVNFGHQASFLSNKTPRPAKKNIVGELILKNYARASKYIGLHFQPYDDFILPPVIKKEIWNAEPKAGRHITVYLLSYSDKQIANHLSQFRGLRFEVFSKETTAEVKAGNMTFLPPDKERFNKSLATGAGIITGAGFETPAEALYLNKKLVVIPVKGQYEQLCNAAALQQMGVSAPGSLAQFHPGMLETTAYKADASFALKSTGSIIANMMQRALADDSDGAYLHEGLSRKVASPYL